MTKSSIVMFGIVLMPLFGLAHPGHGSTDGYTITHYFVEPDHAIFTWSFLIASFFLVSVYRLKKKRSRKIEL